MVCAVDDAVGEFVEGGGSGSVDDVLNLCGVVVRLDLLVAVEDVASALIGG